MVLSPATRRAGFTLTEFLVSAGIVAALVGLLLPAVMKARHAALAAKCSSQLRQVSLAAHHVHDIHGYMPSAWNWFPGPNATGGGAGIGPLFFHLLPFIDQENLYQTSRFTQSSPKQDYFDYGRNVNVRQISLYNCPLDPTLPAQGGARELTPWAGSSYAGNFLVFGRVDENYTFINPFGRPQLDLSFPDGTSNTILFGEKYAVVQGADSKGAGGCHWDYWGKSIYSPFFGLYDPKWTDPNSVGPVRQPPGDERNSRFQVQPQPLPDKMNPSLCATGHSGGMNACFADGSVRLLAADMDKFVWWSLVTPDGGEVPSW